MLMKDVFNIKILFLLILTYMNGTYYLEFIVIFLNDVLVILIVVSYVLMIFMN